MKKHLKGWVKSLHKSCLVYVSKLNKAVLKHTYFLMRESQKWKRSSVVYRGALTLIFIAIIFGMGGLLVSSKSSEKNVYSQNSAEVGFTSFSPIGALGGEIIPASCESGLGEGGYAHPQTPNDTSGDCYPGHGAQGTTNCQFVEGWACGTSPTVATTVNIYDNGVYLGRTDANIYRADLAGAGWACQGTTDHGFLFDLSNLINDGNNHSIRVEGLGQNTVINWFLEPSPLTGVSTGVCAAPALPAPTVELHFSQ